MDEAHKGKHFFGSTKVGEKGQIVIPKEARDLFGINPGDTVLVLGDEQKGLAIVKASSLEGYLFKLMDGIGVKGGGGKGVSRFCKRKGL